MKMKGTPGAAIVLHAKGACNRKPMEGMRKGWKRTREQDDTKTHLAMQAKQKDNRHHLSA